MEHLDIGVIVKLDLSEAVGDGVNEVIIGVIGSSPQ